MRQNMTNLLQSIQERFNPSQPVKPGMYHYISPQDDPRNYRLHLRVEPDGSGVLIVNAATVLHLNQTAAEYAYYFVQNMDSSQVARQMARRYRVEPAQAATDYRDLGQRILALVETPDLDPVTFLDFSRRNPYSARTSAPYRLDCALTYRLPAGADPAFAPQERARTELTTREWKTVLDKAWAAGIPHAIFTGGEPTLRDDLIDLVAHAESLGMVSGLLTDGHRLVEQPYLERLLQTGLDHLLLLLHPEHEQDWTNLQKIMAQDIFVAVHLTLTPENKDGYAKILEKLSNLGMPAVSLTTRAPELTPLLKSARDTAAGLDLELVWDIPVPYSEHNPVRMELPEAERVEGAGRAWLYVEPDGDVLPGQGMETVLGNLLRDPWEQIWQNANQ